jgi:hypothetical protein
LDAQKRLHCQFPNNRNLPRPMEILQNFRRPGVPTR